MSTLNQPIRLKVNGQEYDLDLDPTTPVLWVLRDHLKLKGTKYGCGIGQCGACTVLLDGTPIRSCVLPVAGVAEQPLQTIEGLEHPVQVAWLEEQVAQCGYCQSGQLLAAAALLDRTPRPTDEDIDQQMTNICRCATYPRIRRAIRRAADAMAAPEELPSAGETQE